MSNATYTRPWSPSHVLEREAGVYVPGHFVTGRWVGSEPGFEAGMLIDDIGSNLAHGSGVGRAAIQFALRTPDADVERRVREALTGRHSHVRTLDEAVDDVVEGLWSDVVRSGIAVLEVARLRPKVEDGLGPADGAVILRVPPDAVVETWGRFVQHTSKADRRELGIGWHVRLGAPRFHVLRLSDRVRIGPVLDGLDGTDLAGPGGLASPWDHPDLYRSGYSFSDHAAVRDALVARSSAPVGWGGRGGFNGSMTSHYLVRRVVRFRRYLAHLRGEMTTYLNGVLQSAEVFLGGDPTLVATNVPTDQAFDEAESALSAGDGTFREVLTRIGG